MFTKTDCPFGNLVIFHTFDISLSQTFQCESVTLRLYLPTKRKNGLFDARREFVLVFLEHRINTLLALNKWHCDMWISLTLALMTPAAIKTPILWMRSPITWINAALTFIFFFCFLSFPSSPSSSSSTRCWWPPPPPWLCRWPPPACRMMINLKRRKGEKKK